MCVCVCVIKCDRGIASFYSIVKPSISSFESLVIYKE